MQTLPAQFVLSKNKAPIHHVTRTHMTPEGVLFNHLDPKNWITYEEAKAAGTTFGFVVTENDPYVFLDFDKCRDDPSSQWYPEAARLAGRFSTAGAAVEVSSSRLGLHVLCTADQQAIANKKNKIDGWKEIYWQGRFVQFGPDGWQGNPHVDCTHIVIEEYPDREDHATALIPDEGPCAEWAGPTDDADLIQAALTARKSANAALGTKASFRQLWSGDEEALARFYPTRTEGKPWDASAAEAALASHLAFWTGRDVARMERLIRASKVRHTPDQPKYERTSYTRPTIVDAAKLVTSVYGQRDRSTALPPPGVTTPTALPQPPQGLPTAPESVTALPDGTDVTGEFLTQFEQRDFFRGCTYIRNRHAVLIPDGDVLDEARFNVEYGGREFQMQADGSRPTRKAFECFTQSRCVQFPKAKRTRLDPHAPFGDIDGSGAINMLRLPPQRATEGDVTPFLDHLAKMLPDERDRQIMLAWGARLVQYRGTKFQWSVVVQGAEGNGKTFLLKCFENAVGKEVTHLPNPEDMDERYNEWLEGNVLIGVEEMHVAGRRQLIDRLKKYITGDRIEIRAMRTAKYMTENITNWMFLTNYKDAILKQKNDRRYAVFFCAQQDADDLERDGMSGSYFPDLWNWARNGGFEAVTDYLVKFQPVAEFDPVGAAHRAPVTSSTDDAVRESLGLIEQTIVEAVEDELPGFCGGWISSFRLRSHLDRTLKRHHANQVLKHALDNLGYKEVLRSSPIVEEENRRVRLYADENLRKTGYDNLTKQAYILAQNYGKPPGTNVLPFKKE